MSSCSGNPCCQLYVDFSTRQGGLHQAQMPFLLKGCVKSRGTVHLLSPTTQSFSDSWFITCYAFIFHELVAFRFCLVKRIMIIIQSYNLIFVVLCIKHLI